MFRLSFTYSADLVERVKTLAGSRFDSDTKTWTVLVCTQNLDALRGWYSDGLLDVTVDDLLEPGETVEPVAAAVLRAGTARRPFIVVPNLRSDDLYNRLRAISGGSWDAKSGAMTYPATASPALAELVTRGVINDPERVMSPADIVVAFDVRSGWFAVRGDERASAAFLKSFPKNDVVQVWKDRGIDVAFADTFTEEVYRSELARVGAGLQPDGMAFELFPYQKQAVAMAVERSGLGVFAEMGLGKAASASSKVLTPHGWTTMGEIKVGDMVVGRDGKPTEVLGVFPQGVRPMYTITFSDGVSVEVDEEHLWYVEHPNMRGRGHDGVVLSVKQMLDVDGVATRPAFGPGKGRGARTYSTYYLKEHGNSRWAIPVVDPVEFAPRPAPVVAPYLLGLLLGDGTLREKKVNFTTADSDLIEAAQRSLPEGVELVHAPRSKPTDWNFVKARPLRAMLRDLDLAGKRAWEKHIPDDYLFGSLETRKAVLAGLLDTDGECSKSGTVLYCSTSRQLIDGIVHLVQSLGGVARVSKPRYKTYTHNGEKKRTERASWSVTIALPGDECPFRLARKADRWVPRAKYPPARFIRSIEPAGEAEAVCIKVAAADSLYVIDHFVVTHNTVIAIGAGHEMLVNRAEVQRVVVVVPGAVRTQWAREIVKFTGCDPSDVVVVDGDKKKRLKLYEEAKDKPWMVLNYEIAALDLEHIQPLVKGALLVADEAHRLKSPTAKRTKAMRTLAQKAAKRIALTGTPVENDPGEWYSVISGFVQPGCFGSPAEFLDRYAYRGRFGGWEGARNLGELRERSRVHYLRKTKAEVAEHLPPLRVQHKPLDVDGAYAAALKRAHRDAREEIKADAVARAAKSSRANGILDGQMFDEVESGAEMTAVGMLKLLTLSPMLLWRSDAPSAVALCEAGLVPEVDGPKLDELRLQLAELQAEGNRVVVFASSRRMIELVAERCVEDGIRHVVFTGETNTVDRDAAVQAFTTAGTADNPGPTVFLATDAGGEGLNLGAQCSLLVNLDIPWTPGRLAQRSARIHRIDGKAPSYLVLNMTLRGTIEEGILKMVERKADLQDAIFGEGGGRRRTTGRGGRNVFEQALEAWVEHGDIDNTH
jgi:hypothetical protein